jgi:carboxypeptidase Taq
MRPEAAYDELIRRSREESLLASCVELLAWDEETYLPRAGVGHRANQLALLAGLLHDRAADPRVGDLLADVEGSSLLSDADSPPAVNVREFRRVYQRSIRLPRSLVEELPRIASFAQQEWAIARKHADFARFRPWLEKMVALKRREADCLGYKDHPYDALLDDYEPGARTHDLAVLFAALREELLPLTNALTTARRRPDTSLLQRDYPLDRQRVFSEMAAAALGFDFQAGRLDTTTHPFFASVGPGDCRIATRYQPRQFNAAFFATLHEVGHALYEQGLPMEHYGTPLGEAASLAIHESQSRLWENTVGRNRPFWIHFFPIARQLFPAALRGVQPADFYFAVNNVEPTFIRVTADEVTYNLHILIRFELERALVSGDLPPADLPTAWNEAYRRYLGITPSTDADGCLQDGHWAAGLIGYFPTYTLGNLYAAQLFTKAREEVGDLDAAFALGDFSGLLGWLRDKIYRQGGRYPAARLIERVTGSPLDHWPLVQALWRKYGELYGI